MTLRFVVAPSGSRCSVAGYEILAGFRPSWLYYSNLTKFSESQVLESVYNLQYLIVQVFSVKLYSIFNSYSVKLL